MPRRTKHSLERDPIDPLTAIVTPGGSLEDDQAEEHRQVRAALAEYFLILQEWSQQDRALESDSSQPRPTASEPETRARA